MKETHWRPTAAFNLWTHTIHVLFFLCSVYRHAARLAFICTTVLPVTIGSQTKAAPILFSLIPHCQCCCLSPAGSSHTAPVMCGAEPPRRQITVWHNKWDDSLRELVALAAAILTKIDWCSRYLKVEKRGEWIEQMRGYKYKHLMYLYQP